MKMRNILRYSVIVKLEIRLSVNGAGECSQDSKR